MCDHTHDIHCSYLLGKKGSVFGSNVTVTNIILIL